MKNYCSMMIHLPTAARPTKHQHWCPPCHATTPATPSSSIPHYLGGGTRICREPGSLTAHSSFRSTPCSISHILSYGSTTTLTTPPPPFLISGNSVVRSFSSLDLFIAVEMAQTPPCPFSSSQRHRDHYDDPDTVRLDMQHVYPLHKHARRALR